MSFPFLWIWYCNKRTGKFKKQESISDLRILCQSYSFLSSLNNRISTDLCSSPMLSKIARGEEKKPTWHSVHRTCWWFIFDKRSFLLSNSSCTMPVNIVVTLSKGSNTCFQNHLTDHVYKLASTHWSLGNSREGTVLSLLSIICSLTCVPVFQSSFGL